MRFSDIFLKFWDGKILFWRLSETKFRRREVTNRYEVKGNIYKEKKGKGEEKKMKRKVLKWVVLCSKKVSC